MRWIIRIQVDFACVFANIAATRQFDITHRCVSHETRVCVTRHTCVCHMSHMRTRHDIDINGPCHTYEWVMSHTHTGRSPNTHTRTHTHTCAYTHTHTHILDWTSDMTIRTCKTTHSHVTWRFHVWFTNHSCVQHDKPLTEETRETSPMIYQKSPIFYQKSPMIYQKSPVIYQQTCTCHVYEYYNYYLLPRSTTPLTEEITLEIFVSPDLSVFLIDLISDEDSVYSRESWFEILGTPVNVFDM